MTVTRSDGTQIEKAKFQFIYDPDFKEGIDIQILYNPDSIGYIKSRELSKC